MLATSRSRKGELIEIVFERLGTAERGRVLVVEANPCDLTYTRIALIGQGFAAVDAAMNLKQAYEQTKNTDYQVVLIDYSLPDGNGLELLEWLDNKSEVIMLAGQSAHERNSRTAAVYSTIMIGNEATAI